MKTLFTWAFIFVFGFVIGAGVGFKVLEGVSTGLVVEAMDNSYAQFQQSYSGSVAQKAANKVIFDKIEEQKQVVMDQIKAGMVNYIKGLFTVAQSGSIVTQ